MTKGLNEQLEQFRNRNLSEQEYPFLWVDALYEKIRQDGRVINMAVQVVCCVNRDGYRYNKLLYCLLIVPVCFTPYIYRDSKKISKYFTTLID